MHFSRFTALRRNIALLNLGLFQKTPLARTAISFKHLFLKSNNNKRTFYLRSGEMEKPSASTSNTKNVQQRQGNQGDAKQKGTVQRQKGPGRLRGFDTDSQEIRISKTISWLLRHSAQRQGLAIRTDGYAKVSDILQHHKIKSQEVTLEMIQAIVKTDKKQRFDIRVEPSESSAEGVWWMKANQGHTVKSIQLELQPITSVADIPTGIAVHGTNGKAWESIATQGLSRMERNHIHLAQGVGGESVVSGMRKYSQILIFINVQKALDAGIEFFLSDNGVILTAGDANGILKPEFFDRVENSRRVVLPGWQGSTPRATT